MSMPYDPFGTKARAAYFEDRAREARNEHRRREGQARQAAALEARNVARTAAKLAAKRGGSYQPAVATAEAAGYLQPGHEGCRCSKYTEPQRAAIRSAAWQYCLGAKMPAVRMSAGESSRWVSAQLRVRELYQATLRCVLHGFSIAASLARWSKDAGPAPSAAELQARVQAYAAKGRSVPSSPS
jgi:hypothetical protein